MAEFKDVTVGDRVVRVYGADEDALKDAEKTVKADSELVSLEIDNPDHANLTFAELQDDAAPVPAADPVNAGDNVNDAQGRTNGATE